MIEIFLVAVFTIHASLFLRTYLRDRKCFYFLVTSFGFVVLTVFYGYRAWALHLQPAGSPDWMGYLRWSGVAMCAISLPALAKRLHLEVKAWLVRRSQAQSIED